MVFRQIASPAPSPGSALANVLAALGHYYRLVNQSLRAASLRFGLSMSESWIEIPSDGGSLEVGDGLCCQVAAATGANTIFIAAVGEGVEGQANGLQLDHNGAQP